MGLFWLPFTSGNAPLRLLFCILKRIKNWPFRPNKQVIYLFLQLEGGIIRPWFNPIGFLEVSHCNWGDLARSGMTCLFLVGVQLNIVEKDFPCAIMTITVGGGRLDYPWGFSCEEKGTHPKPKKK